MKNPYRNCTDYMDFHGTQKKRKKRKKKKRRRRRKRRLTSNALKFIFHAKERKKPL